MGDDLTIIIPFWNGHKTIKRLLDSLPDILPVIIINDYGSKTPSVNRKNTRVVNLKERGYFSGACNAGFEECDTDVLILNQDLYFTSDEWLQGIKLAKRVGIGVYGDGVFGHPAWPSGYVQGTFMYISREALNNVGGFNKELYPLWGATAEFQLRACREGLEALPVHGIPGMGHEDRDRYGSAIEKALTEEPDKKSSFINTPPEISVIVPLFNYGRYLEACIGSLMAQTMQSFEVVIVDDHSTDDSLTIARGLQSFKRGVRVLWHTENHGTAAAINTGIKHAHGKYITILSADDTLEPYSLARHYHANLENSHGFTYGDIYFVTGDRREEVRMQKFDYDKLVNRNHVPAGIMYPRQAWLDAGGYPEIMNDGREDWAFAVGLGRVGYCGVHIGQTGYLVRREKQNRSLRNQAYGHKYFLDKIRAVYPDVYAGGYIMACCGKRGKMVSTTKPVTLLSSAVIQQVEGFTLLEYTGKNMGTETLWCPSGAKYKYGRSQRRVRVLVADQDLDFVMKTGLFRIAVIPVAKIAPKEVKEVKNEETVVIDLSDGVSKEEASMAGKALAEYEPEEEESKEVDATYTAIKLANENDIDLALVEATGKNGRVTKADVERYIASQAS